VCYPAARVKTLIFFGPVLLRKVRASWLLTLWLALQFFYVNTEIAWAAHLGGFTFGALVGAYWRWRETRARRALPPPPAPEAAPALR
jgi:membrane associated rhomboid family serine protease